MLSKIQQIAGRQRILLTVGAALLAMATIAWKGRSIGQIFGFGAHDSGGPKINLSDCPLFLGKGVPGDILTSSVPIRNVGGRELIISRLESTCDCAFVNLSPMQIPSGQSAELKVGARLTEDKETLQFNVYLFSNDPDLPTVSYSVRAECPPVIRVEPTRLNFGSIAVGSIPKPLVLKVYQPDGTPWPKSKKLLSESEYGLISVAVAAPGPNDEVLRLEVSILRQKANGSFEDFIRIMTAGSQRTVRIPVSFCNVPIILAAPSTLFFARLSGQIGPWVRHFLLRRHDGKPLAKITRIMAPPGVSIREPNSDATLVAGEDTKRMVVVLDPTKVQTNLDAPVSLWLENEKEPIVIRVIAYSN